MKLNDCVTITELRQISHENLSSFSLYLSENETVGERVVCSKILRCLPGKRLSGTGELAGRPVFVKLFIDPSRAKIHWQREITGVLSLTGKKIETPKLIRSGRHSDQGFYFCVFEYLVDARTLTSYWDEGEPKCRINLLLELTQLLAKHHQAGIVQKDLHLNNFLKANRIIYTLDGGDITLSPNTLSKQESFDNLAAFFAQFPPANDIHIEACVSCYGQSRNLIFDSEDIRQLNQLTETIRQQRKHEYLNKIKRECTAFVCHRRWYRFMVYSRKHGSDELLNLFAKPDQYMDRGTMIKKGNTCTVASVRLGQRTVVIKRYNIKNWRHAFNRAFRPSRAYCAWYNAHRLGFYGIETPTPIALLENRWGPLRRGAYFIAEYADGISSSDFFLNPKIDKQEKFAAAKNVTQLLLSLWKLKISHGDLKANNILLENGRVILIDLDSMQQHSRMMAFKRSWQKDMIRFFKNWAGSKEVKDLFERQLEGYL